MPEMRLARLHPVRWLGQRDRGFAALRRAARAAIVMPAMFAAGDKVIGNPQLATFAAFGSFAIDFGGPMAERLQAQAALAVTGGCSSAWPRWPRRPRGSRLWRWRWWVRRDLCRRWATSACAPAQGACTYANAGCGRRCGCPGWS
jgi:hypothetical protein